MADVRTIIDVDLNTSAATAKLRQLQRDINSFTLGLNKNNILQTGTIKQLKEDVLDLANSSRFFTGEVVRMRTAASRLDATLSRGQVTMGQFFSARFKKDSFAAAQVLQLANERARSLQTQFIATSGAANGFQEAVAVRPLAAFNSQVAVSTQQLAIQRAMFRQATTSMINFGKNVQWAGRQLMVGFTIPLTIFGAVAGKAFRDLEKEAVNFKKVYGDVFTTEAETEKMLEEVKGLTKEFTKYGVAAQKTMQLAAVAAQAGQQGAELIAATREAIRLSTLGDMEQEDAMRTAIALQSAFKLSSDELAESINYLNFVENSTVLSLQDLAAAIPRVAPVIVGLGGNVRDMSIFLAAMREGGVTAAEAANGLKSSLGRLITPTKQATDMAASFGINLEKIVQVNRGDLLGTVMELANAMKSLGNIEKQQLLSTLFGKFQYARIGALFENITREGSQANRLIQDIGISTQELAQTADKELSAIENSISVKFTKAMEDLKIAIAPIGELFIKLSIPIVKFLGKIAEAFNNLPDFAKNFIAGGVAITGIFIPAIVMVFGLVNNLIGQLLKMGGVVAIFVKGLTSGGLRGALDAVRQSFQYMSLAELDTATASQQLASATNIVNQALLDQVLRSEGATAALIELGSMYDLVASKARNFASAQGAALAVPARGMAISKYAGAKTGGVRRNTGGTIPGFGQNKDTVPAVLTPGEFVVNRDATKQNFQLLQAINNGDVQGFNGGGMPGAGPGLFMQRVQQTQKMRTQMAQQQAQASQLQDTHIYFSGKRRSIKYGNIDPRIGGSQVEDIKDLAKLGFPVEQLDDKYLRLPFNRDLINGIKGIKAKQMLEELDPDIDILGPAFKRANVDQRKLIDNLIENIDDRMTYKDFGPNAFGQVVSKSLGTTRVNGLPSQLRLGTLGSIKEKFPNEVALAMASPGQRVPVGNTGASLLYEDNKLFAITPNGVKLMSSGTRGHRMNRGGGVARSGRMFYGNILGAIKVSQQMAKAAYGGKYPPLFSSRIPGTNVFGFGEGARQPAMGGAPGVPTTLMNLIRQVSTDSRFGERLQARVLINGQEAVINRVGSRQLDRLGRNTLNTPIALETRPISSAREKQFFQQWEALGKPGLTRGNNFDEYKAFESFMLKKGYHRNQRQGYFYKPIKIGLNDPILGEVLMPRSMMGTQQQEFPSFMQKFMSGGYVFGQQLKRFLAMRKSGATPQQIKSEYKKLAKQYHPDINPANDEKMKQITQAYSELMPKKKIRLKNYYGGRMLSLDEADRDFDTFKSTNLTGKFNLSENSIRSGMKSGEQYVAYDDIRTGSFADNIRKGHYIVTDANGSLGYTVPGGMRYSISNPLDKERKHNVFPLSEFIEGYNQGGMIPKIQKFFLGGIAKFFPARMMWQSKTINQALAKMKQGSSLGALKQPTGIMIADDINKAVDLGIHPMGMMYDIALQAGYSKEKTTLAMQNMTGKLINEFGILGNQKISLQQYEEITNKIQKEFLEKLTRETTVNNKRKTLNLFEELNKLGMFRGGSRGRAIGKPIMTLEDGVQIVGQHLVGQSGGYSKFGKKHFEITRGLYNDKPGNFQSYQQNLKLYQRGHNEGGIIPGYNAGGNVMKSFISGRVFDSSRKTIVPGAGNKDTVAAKLTPGEFVVNKQSTKENLGLLKAINSGAIGYAKGGIAKMIRGYALGDIVAANASDVQTREPSYYIEGRDGRTFGPMTYDQALRRQKQLRSASARKRLVPPPNKQSGAMGGMRGMGMSTVMGMGGMGMMIYGQEMQAKAMQRGEESSVGGLLSQAGMATSALSFLPFLKLTKALPIAGFIALGAGIAGLVVAFNKTLNATKDLNNAMFGSAKMVKNVATELGRTTKSQDVGFMRALGTSNVTQESMSFAQEFSKGESFKTMLKEIKMVAKAGEDTSVALRNQLGRLIVSGILSPEEASSIAIEMGNALNDQNIAFQTNAQLLSIFGPDGKKLEAGNIVKILATISPTMDEKQLDKTLAESLEQSKKFTAGPGASIMENINQFARGLATNFATLGGDDMVLNLMKMKTIQEGIVNAAQLEREARAQVLLELQQGLITAEKYQSVIEQLNKSSKASQMFNIGVQDLEERTGLTREQLENQKQGFLQQGLATAAVGAGIGALVGGPAGAVVGAGIGLGIDFFTTDPGEQAAQFAAETDKSFKKFAEEYNIPSSVQEKINSLTEELGTIGLAEFKTDIMSGAIDENFLTKVLSLPEDQLSKLAEAEGGLKALSQEFGIINSYPQQLDFAIQLKLDGKEKELESLQDNLLKVQSIPPMVQKAFKLDFGTMTPEELENWGSKAEGLSALWPMLERLDPVSAEIAAKLTLDENGKPKTPEVFLKDALRVEKAVAGLSSGDKKIKKESIIELLTLTKDENGNAIDDPNKAYNDLVAEFGEAKILNLPEDVLRKVINLQAEVEGTEEMLAAVNAGLEFAEGGEKGILLRQKAALEKLLKSQKETLKSSVLSGQIGAGESGKTGGGGGEESLAKELARRAKEAQEQLEATNKIFAGNKEIIAGPFGSKFIEFVQSQGKRFVDLVKQGTGAVTKAYKDYIVEQTALGNQARKTFNEMFPQQLKIERGRADVTRGAIVDRGFAQQDVDFAFEQMESRGTLDQFLSAKKGTEEYKKLNNEFTKLLKQSKELREIEKKFAFPAAIESMRTETEKLNDQSALMTKFNWDEEMASAAVDAGINIKSAASDVKIFTQEWNNSKDAALRALGPEGIKKYLRDLQSELNDINKEIATIQIIEPLEKQMQGLEKQNEAIARRIELLERTKEPIQNEIDRINKIVDLRQREIELLGRRIEPLEEEKERLDEIYQSQIEALDKVSQKEDLLFRKRQGQMNVAQALSRGDVAGAAQAALAARQDMASARMEQTRRALDEQHKEKIKVLDDEIKNIRDQQKLIELEIRDYQDQIYNLGLQILPIDDQIKNLKLEQRNIQDEMYNLQLRINDETFRLNEQFSDGASRLANLTAEAERLRAKLQEAANVAATIGSGGGGGGGAGGSNSGGSSSSSSSASAPTTLPDRIIVGPGISVPVGKPPSGPSNTFIPGYKPKAYGGKIKKMAYGGRVNYRGSRELPPGMAFGGKVKKYANGSLVPGMGNTDRVPAMLMPGEFVVNKAATQRNLPLLNALNSTKFPSLLKNSGGPVIIDIMVPTRYRTNVDVSSNPSTVVNSPTSNNMYQITFNMPNMAGSPNAVANAVIGKIREIEDRSVRSVRL